MNYFTNHKKLTTALIIAILAALIALAYWLWLGGFFNQRVSQQPNWEKKILSAPPLPAEPEIVLAYTGSIKNINLNQGELTILTAFGNKKVTFDNTLIPKILIKQDAPASPPSPTAAPRPLDQLTKAFSLIDLRTGDLIQASSLKNIRGLTTFKADTIVVFR